VSLHRTLLHQPVQRRGHHRVHPRLPRRPALDESAEEVLQLLRLRNDILCRRRLGRWPFPRHDLPGGLGHLVHRPVGVTVDVPFARAGRARACSAGLHPVVEPVVEVRGVGVHERGEVAVAGPRAFAFAEPGHIEHAPTAPRGEEHLLVRRVPLREQAVHERQRLDGDGPRPRPPEPARHGGHARGHACAGVPRQRQDLRGVALVCGGVLAVRRGPHDGRLDVRGHLVRGARPNKGDGRLVLGRAHRLPELARRHAHAPGYWRMVPLVDVRQSARPMTKIGWRENREGWLHWSRGRGSRNEGDI
jgi:hypothetical protein